jgi:hypothetical protein
MKTPVVFRACRFFGIPALLLSVNFGCNPPQVASHQDVDIPALKPWGYSIDSLYALRYPDRYAWDLFRAVNWPADTTFLAADTTKHLGDPGLVVWQTWKTAPKIYLPDGSKPGAWDEQNFEARTLEDFSPFSIKEKLPDITQDPTYGLEEVAMNKPAFEYVVAKELYNLNGQLELYNSDEAMAFPREALEVKVKWRRIADRNYDKARYHWQYITVKDSGHTRKELYGLVAIHITSRVLKKWLWATFEHVDSRSQKHEGDDGWLLPSKDRFACYDPPYDCERAPVNIGLEGTKWEYFLLRGTQTDYLDENQRPSLLANSNVERGFQLSSSCITCHSLATIGPTYTQNDTVQMHRIDFLPQPPFTVDGVMFGGKGYVGTPDSTLFRLKDGRKMKQSDFVWSLSRAAWKASGSTPIIKE